MNIQKEILEEADKQVLEILNRYGYDTALYRNRPPEEYEHYPYPEFGKLHDFLLSSLNRVYEAGKEEGYREGYSLDSEEGSKISEKGFKLGRQSLIEELIKEWPEESMKKIPTTYEYGYDNGLRTGLDLIKSKQTNN